MLILTRRIGEMLMIGDDITVSILDVRGNQIRIGVEAPKDVPVHREEVYERIKAGLKQGESMSDKREVVKRSAEELNDLRNNQSVEVIRTKIKEKSGNY